MKLFYLLIVVCFSLLYSGSSEYSNRMTKGRYPSYQKKATIYTSEVIDNGAFLILSDNSIWKVHPKYLAISGGWITPAKIEIKKSNSPQYPHILTNSITKDYILAKKSSKHEIKTYERLNTPLKTQKMPKKKYQLNSKKEKKK